MKRTVRFAIADDDHAFRTLLGKAFTAYPFYRMLFCAGDGMDFVWQLGRQWPDLMVIDLYMPRMSGLEMIQLIRKTNKKCFVIAYSSFYQEDVFRSLQLLPDVFYCERHSPTIVQLAGTLFNHAEMPYETYLREWKSVLPADIIPQKEVPAIRLSATELQLISMTHDGYTNKEIANKLFFSPRTVDTYIERLLNKLGLRNKTDIVRYAVEHGICKLHCDIGREGSCDRDSIFKPE